MPAWLVSAWDTVAGHVRFYIDFAQLQWAHISPTKYLTLLVFVSVVGFVMMGRGTKR